MRLSQQACAMMHPHDTNGIADYLVHNAIVANNHLADVFPVEFRHDAAGEWKFGQSTGGGSDLVN